MTARFASIVPGAPCVRRAPRGGSKRRRYFAAAAGCAMGATSEELGSFHGIMNSSA